MFFAQHAGLDLEWQGEQDLKSHPTQGGKALKTSGMKLFSGNANAKLAAEIAGQLGMNLGKITVSRFADGEVNVMVHENVRGKDVYIVQVQCPTHSSHISSVLLLDSQGRDENTDETYKVEAGQSIREKGSRPGQPPWTDDVFHTWWLLSVFTILSRRAPR